MNKLTASLQVLYPTANDTTFDQDYYSTKHMQVIDEHMGPYIADTMIVKGLAGGRDTPADFHVIATMTFSDQSTLAAALAAAGPVLVDIPNFFDGQPQMLIGEVKSG
jgi:uncharacterized protein (TIGR02118 family)